MGDGINSRMLECYCLTEQKEKDHVQMGGGDGGSSVQIILLKIISSQFRKYNFIVSKSSIVR